ncbi:MAG: hypothetical protein Q9160_005010 [Pyrenula sp. 1 TL-2023]
MVKPLSFKGDKKAKKRKHAKVDEEQDPDVIETKALQASDAATTEDDTWVSADAPSDLSGPLIFVLPTAEPTALSCDSNGSVFPLTIENMIEEDPWTAEPHDVRQVWIATRVAGIESVTFKGHHGKYLACDRYGLLSAKREAVGIEETFKVIAVPDTAGLFAVQALISDGEDHFIAAREEDTKSKGPEIRGDATDISFNTSLRIRMQARFKPKLKANKETKAREKISRKELEAVVGRRLEEDEVRRLKKARREGTYHEEILDVRVKGKHDKFAS